MASWLPPMSRCACQRFRSPTKVAIAQCSWGFTSHMPLPTLASTSAQPCPALNWIPRNLLYPIHPQPPHQHWNITHPENPQNMPFYLWLLHQCALGLCLPRPCPERPSNRTPWPMPTWPLASQPKLPGTLQSIQGTFLYRPCLQVTER